MDSDRFLFRLLGPGFLGFFEALEVLGSLILITLSILKQLQNSCFRGAVTTTNDATFFVRKIGYQVLPDNPFRKRQRGLITSKSSK